MEYIISIEATGGKKVCLHPGGRDPIYLYPGDIRKLGLKDGDSLAKERFENIRAEYVIPRAKKRALGILSKKDCTKKQLEDSLRKSLYDEESIRDAISFVESYGYVNDLRYAREYIYYKRKKKSFRQIRFDLASKGIPEDLIVQAIEEAGQAQDKEEVRKQFEKYSAKFLPSNTKDRQKVYMHFARKGYERELILSLIDEWSQD